MNSPSEPTIAGRFELIEELGFGNTGVVWRAVDLRRGEYVAVKFLGRAHEDDAEAMRLFEREVRAQAQLRHPGIVELIDYGTVDEGTTLPSTSGIRRGSPYLVMEYADAGSIRRHQMPQHWSALRHLLLVVLDALGFAHAYDVVHRDLKPQNLLCFGPPGDLQIKIGDFGLAHALDRLQSGDRAELTHPSAGTVHYMPPEQLRGHWRRFGPWTDLYQLGVIAWEMATGCRPFQGTYYMEVAVKHLRESPEPMDPKFAVPDGFEDWCRGMLEKRPGARYQRTVEAARDLAALPSKQQATHPMRSVPPVLSEAIGRSETQGPAQRDDRGFAAARRSASCAPARWNLTDYGERGDHPAPLEIWGVRRPSFVDRGLERQTLWGALHRVLQECSPQIAIIEGTSGTGKSRLAQELLRHAHQTAGTESMLGEHLRDGGPWHGIRDLLQRQFRTWNLEGSELVEHLEAMLDHLPGETDVDPRALAELIAPGSADDASGRFHFTDDNERIACLTGVARSLARARPLVVWLDDLQWGAKSVDWLRDLMSTEASLPVLVVATARTDTEGSLGRPVDEVLDELESSERVSRMELGPLRTEDERTLIRSMLPLEEDLTERLQRRSEGNPLFAVQLVGDWVDRDLLRTSGSGFILEKEDDAEVPDAIHEVWRRRIERLVHALPGPKEQTRECLEIAATLGRRVRSDEWTSACQISGLNPPERLKAELFDRGLADEEPDGWRFDHSLLVESLLADAAEAHRARDHHLCCARMLAGRATPQTGILEERRASHLMAARRYKEALEPLSHATNQAFQDYDKDASHRLLEQRRQLIERLDLPEDHPDRLETDIDVAKFRRLKGDLEDARQRTSRLLGDIDWTDQPPTIHFELLRLHAWLQADLGSVDDALGTIAHALHVAEASQHKVNIARALYTRAHFQYQLDEIDPEPLERAARLAEEDDSPLQALICRRMRGELLAYLGETERARELLERLAPQARSLGARQAEIAVQNALGELARRRRDWPDAIDRYSAALRLDKRGDRSLDSPVAINLALAYLGHGDADAAEPLLDRVIEKAESTGKWLFASVAQLGRVACAIIHRDLDAAGAALDRAEERLRQTEARTEDHRWIVELALEHAEAWDAPEVTRRLDGIADILQQPDG
jgi:serine/threonine protein kinase/tetratricopeptide (TPR) repeat protein